jgi:hypothetical protein
MEAKTYQLMGYHGPFSADDPVWDAQARLEEKLLKFCYDKTGREPRANKRTSPRQRFWVQPAGFLNLLPAAHKSQLMICRSAVATFLCVRSAGLRILQRTRRPVPFGAHFQSEPVSH